MKKTKFRTTTTSAVLAALTLLMVLLECSAKKRTADRSGAAGTS